MIKRTDADGNVTELWTQRDSLVSALSCAAFFLTWHFSKLLLALTVLALFFALDSAYCIRVNKANGVEEHPRPEKEEEPAWGVREVTDDEG